MGSAIGGGASMMSSGAVSTGSNAVTSGAGALQTNSGTIGTKVTSALNSRNNKNATDGIGGANVWVRAFAAAVDGWKAGYKAYYKTKSAKLQANTQAYQAEGQAKIAGLSAEMVRSNKLLQDIDNRQQLDTIGRQQAAYTAAYREMQGSNTAQAAAGNVDVSSGSAAAVYEGNASNYAMDSAAIRRAYDLQQWSGESALAMMEAQAKGLDYQQATYEKTASAYRTVAKLQGSSGWNAILAGTFKAADSFFGTGFGSWAYDN